MLGIITSTILLIFTSNNTIQDSYANSVDLVIEVPNTTDFETITSSPSSSSTTTNESDVVVKSKIVDINLDALDGNEITIRLYDNEYDVVKDYVKIRNSTDYVWAGHGKDVNVVLTVFDSEVYGTIRTLDGLFTIRPNHFESDTLNYHKLSLLALGNLPIDSTAEPTQIDSSLSTASDVISPEQMDKIRALEASYSPNKDYSDNKVTIDVYIGYTTAVKDEDSSIENKIQHQIDKANDANQASGLPVELNLIKTDEVRYTEKSSIDTDLWNLNPNRGNDPAFDRLRADAINEEDDILVLITHPGNRSIDINNYQGCGFAQEILAQSVDNAVAVVAYLCLNDIVLTHEIGHLQGAGHNKDADDFGNEDNYTNFWFTAGHGYYDVDANGGSRTIMSTDCDDEQWTFENGIENPTCTSWEVWSDPTNDFHASSLPTGTFDKQHNAKIIFATGPYIASLRGDVQTYDNISPQGLFEWLGDHINKIFTQGETLDIKATFTETIDDDYPPFVTIKAANNIGTTSEMTKHSDTTYTHSHQLTDELGDVTLSFSNARDLYGNKIITDAISGGTIEVKVDTPPPIDTILSTVTIPNPEPGIVDRFGWTVAGIGNDKVVVGAYSDDPGGIREAGSAYVFNVNDGTIITTINNPDPDVMDNFGRSVAGIGDDKVVVGSMMASDSDDLRFTGSAFVFDANNGTLITPLENPNPGIADYFGRSVAGIGDDKVVVGSANDEPNGVKRSGSAYIFDANNGTMLFTLDNPRPDTFDKFGFSVAGAGDDKVVVGSAVATSSSGMDYAGAAFIFDANTGELLVSLENPNPNPDDNFGYSVAGIGDDKVVVGANNDNTSSALNYTGTAYVFDATTGDPLLTIPNPTPGVGDNFGYSVAGIGDDKVVVGANYDKDNPSDTHSAGTAYVFDATTGELLVTLDNPDHETSKQFGNSVAAISDNKVIAGSPFDYNSDDMIVRDGTVYIFELGSGLDVSNPAAAAITSPSLAP